MAISQRRAWVIVALGMAAACIGGPREARAGLPEPASRWTGDAADIAGGVALDPISAVDATIVGDAVTIVAGQVGEAFQFPRADSDHLDLGDVYDPGTGSLSVSFWFRADETSGTQFLVGKGNHGSTAVGWSIWLDGSTLVVRGHQNGATNDQRFAQNIPGVVEAGEWHHMALVLDRDLDIGRGYLDGSNEGWKPGGGGGVVDTLVDGSDISNTTSLLVGRRSTGGAPFGGAIDDLVIWTDALTPGQVAAIARGASPVPDPADTTAPATPAGFGGYAEESRVVLTWDPVADVDLEAYVLTRAESAGGPYAEVAGGLVSTGYVDTTVTDGVTYHYQLEAVDLADNPSAPAGPIELTPQAGVDLTAPLAPTSLLAVGLDAEVALEWTPPTLDELGTPEAAVTFEVLRADAEDGPFASVADGLDAAAWSDTTVVNDQTYFYQVVAIDAAENASQPSGVASATPEVPELPPPVARWTFDAADVVETTVFDRTGGLDGTLVGGDIASIEGRVGQALLYPGADSDHVDLGDVLDPEAESFSVSLWMRSDVDTGTRFIVGKGNASSSGVGWSVWLDGGTTLVVRGQQTGGEGGDRFAQRIEDAVVPGVWHHVALVLDRGGNVVRGYLDGSNAGWVPGGGGGQVDTLVPGSSIANGDPLLVGRRATTGAPFLGAIDDLVVWRAALTPGQVVALASGGSPVSGGDDTTPPATPSGLVAVSEDGLVTLDWDDVVDADRFGYTVYRAEASGGPYSVVAPAIDLVDSALVDMTVVNETTYFYVVTATDLVGNESDPTEEVEAFPTDGADHTPPAAPLSIIAAGLESSIRIDWPDSPEEDLASYSLLRSETSGGPYDVLADALTDSEYEDTTATAGATYFYVAVAIDAAGNPSDPSPEDDAATGALDIPFPLAWWSLDEADIDGTVVVDRSGVRQNGDIVGEGVVSVEGRIGEALSLPGLDTDYVGMGDTLDPGPSSFTVALWVWADRVDGAAQFIVGKGNASSGAPGWSIWLENGTLFVRGQQVDATNDDRFGQGRVGVIAGTWLHVALVIDRDANTVRGYVGGSNDGWVAGGGGAQTDVLVPGSSIENSDELRIGRRATDGAPLAGAVDDVIVWDVALTPRQLEALAVGYRPSAEPLDETPPGAPTGLVALGSDGEVLLDWDSSVEEDLAGYTVYRGEASGGPYDVIASALETSEHEDTTVTNGVTYFYVVTASDLVGNESDPSAEAEATPEEPGGGQLPGDANQDGKLDISDAISIFGFLFLGTPASLPCGDGTGSDPANIALVDTNGDGRTVDLSDGVYVLTFLFSGGSPPALGVDCVRIVGCPEVCDP